MRHSRIPAQKSAEIECCPLWRCHSHPVDLDDFVAREPLVARDDAGRWVVVVPYQLDGRILVDPQGAMQCRRCPTRDDAAALRPQPRARRVCVKRRLRDTGHVYVRIDRPVCRSEPAAAHLAATDKGGRKVQARADPLDEDVDVFPRRDAAQQHDPRIVGRSSK